MPLHSSVLGAALKGLLLLDSLPSCPVLSREGLRSPVLRQLEIALTCCWAYSSLDGRIQTQR
eukprot:6212392-Pleurochrysis_carterae.AAC.2